MAKKIQHAHTQDLERLYFFLKSEKLIKDMKDLHSKIGGNYTHLSSVRNGNAVFSKRLRNKIINYFGLEVVKEEEKTNIRRLPLTPKDHIENDIEHFSTKNNDFIIVNGRIFMKVYKIPMKAHARYVDEFYNEGHDVSFEYEYVLVEQYGKGNYKQFIIEGDSMDDGRRYSPPDGSVVLAREIGQHLWTGGLYSSERGHIIITNKNILCKDIIKFDKERGVITCHSRNEQYEDFDLPLGFAPDGDTHVRQIFKILKIGNI